MSIEASSLRSKVARRIFWIFLSCALLPCAALIAISYVQVEQFFTEKNQRELRDLAKIFGLDLHERLTLLDENLQNIGMLAQLGTSPNEVKRQLSAQGERWRSIAYLRSDGTHEKLLGTLDHRIQLTPAQRKHLSQGRGLLSFVPASSDGSLQIFMVAPQDSFSLDKPLLLGEVNPSYLWGIGESRLLPAHIQFCVKDRSGLALRCPDTMAKGLPASLHQQVSTQASGEHAWSDDGHNYLASYWTIPMKYYFNVSGWTVILQTTREGTFASIADLKTTFALAILATLCISILLVFTQIRRQLVPVEKLKESTLRLAEKDFDYRVDVRSGDEFQELADSINQMAGQLGRHFRTLSTRADIDRAVLSVLKSETIIETILSRSMALIPCEAARLTLFSTETSEPKQLFLLTGGHDSVQQHPIAATSESHDPVSRWVHESRRPMLFSDAEIKALELPFADKEKIHAILASPLFIKDRLLGVLAFHSHVPNRFTDDDVSFLESLSSQAAVAIYNSRLFERTTQQATDLAKANQAKDEFLSVMSHELRTPLNVMMGYVTLLQQRVLGDLNDEQVQALATVDRHSKELLGLIDSIMEATFLQTGNVLVDKKPMNPATPVEDLRARFQLAPDKAINLRWHCDPDLPTVFSDELKITRILNCLFDNAVKFTEAGDVSLSAHYLADRNRVQFTVQDSGIGIPTEAQSRIFEIFQQADNSGTRTYGGLGLGLYIAKQTANLIGADLELESTEGKGTKVTLSVPVGSLSAAVMNKLEDAAARDADHLRPL